MLFYVVLLLFLSEYWCRDVDGQGSSVTFEGNEYPDVKLAFQQIPLQQLESGSNLEKNLDHLLVLNNSAPKSFDKNAFGNFRVFQIVVHNRPNLNRVEVDAFEQTKKGVRTIKIDKIGLNDEFQEDFFEVLNNLGRLDVLELFNHNFKKILPYTFRQEYLSELYLKGPLEEVQNNAFYYLDNINMLRIQSNKTINIHEHAFDMKSTKNETLHIYLEGAFKPESGIFTNTYRPLRINLSLNKLTSFDPAIFKPILMSQQAHTIILYGKLVEVEFDQCQLVWLFKDPKFKGAIIFKDEPEISLEYFDQWHCNVENVIKNETQVPEVEIDQIEPIEINHAVDISGGKSQMFSLVVLIINIFYDFYSM